MSNFCTCHIDPKECKWCLEGVNPMTTETPYDRYLDGLGRLTMAQAEKLKKGEPLLYYGPGSFEWVPVEFDSVRTSQGSPVVIVKTPEGHMVAYYERLKTIETNDLLEVRFGNDD